MKVPDYTAGLELCYQVSAKRMQKKNAVHKQPQGFGLYEYHMYFNF